MAKESFILLLAYSFQLLPSIILELYHIRHGLFRCFSRATSIFFSAKRKGYRKSDSQQVIIQYRNVDFVQRKLFLRCVITNRTDFGWYKLVINGFLMLGML